MKALSVQEQLTMSSLEIAELTGKRHDNILADIRNMFDELGLEAPEFSGAFKMPSGQKATVFNLPKDLTITLITGYSVPLRHKINKRWLELEGQQFHIPQTLPEALRLAATAMDERDEAIRTKAEISSRREATAMAKASAAVRRLKKLEREQEKQRVYCTIRRATIMFPNRKFSWRVLKDAAMGMELPTIDIPDELYGAVKGYHADVWLACYGLDVMEGDCYESVSR
jgi:phage regulator Rha-like protein